MNAVPDVSQAQRPYKRYGAAIAAWRTRRREVLLCGPAGTGKSRALLEKQHYCADKYAGMRGLIVRKTRKSITQSTMVTFEKKVLPEGCLGHQVFWRTTEQEYRYPNGSIIAVAGLDDPAKVMSSEWDMIYVQEATELDEEDWGSLTTRLRNGVMPYQQLIADCNPAHPEHWLKLRCDRGATLLIESKHEDNPMVTPEYLASLDELPRVLYLRLRKGQWAAAEGAVYQDEWNPAVHLMDHFEIPNSWPRYWAIDWGFRNPFVWQAWARNPDGILYRYREIYRTDALVEDLAAEIMDITKGEPRPASIICDHDAEDRATFEKHTRLRTTAAEKSVSTGIQDVRARLRVRKDGKSGMYFLRDSLVSIDRGLERRHLPFCTEKEFEVYVWDIANGRKIGEEPVKKFDHGMDACRYLCRHMAVPELGGGMIIPTIEEEYAGQGWF